MLKDISLAADGRTMFKFVPSEAFKFEKGELTVLAQSRLYKREGLVGMVGAYFHPTILSASSCGEVLDAWEWIGKEVGESFYQMPQYLTAGFVLRKVMTRNMNFAVIAPMEVAIRLHRLSRVIDVKPKIDELKRALEGNVKSWTKDQTLGWYKNVEQIVRFLSDLNSEFEFALFSFECGLSVKLAKKPDMYVAEVPVEVKSLSRDSSLSTRKYTRKLIDRATRAFQAQHAELVGLSIGIDLVLLGLAKRQSARVRKKEFCAALENSLVFAKNRRKPVLLFYHDPWTGDVQARTETGRP